MGLVLKILLGIVTLGACAYSATTFGIGLWSVVFAIFGLFLFTSPFVPALENTATVVGRIVAVLSLFAFLLLLLASTIGGSSHMSESNQVIAFFLFIMAFFGFGLFLVRLRKPSASDD